MNDLSFLLAILIVNALLGVLCIAVARGERESPALRLWGWGMLLYALGLVVVLSRLGLPGPITAFAGNLIIAWAPVPATQGVLAHAGTRLDGRWVVPLFGLVVAALAVNNFLLAPRFLLNALPPTLVAIVLFTVGAVRLLRSSPPDARIAARFVATILLLAVGVWALRLLLLVGALGDPEPVTEALVIDLLGIAQIVVTVAATFALFSIEVLKIEAVLKRAALLDMLTGLPNRRAATARFDEEMGRAVRHRRSLAMLVFDIDHFKRVNDEYGHLTGDAVIQHVAATLSQHKRQGDVLARIGGEEFVLLLSEVEGTAAGAAERLRRAVAETSLSYGGQRFEVTVSGGLALYPEDGADWDALFAAADRRLYASKQAGRNRVTGPVG